MKHVEACVNPPTPDAPTPSGDVKAESGKQQDRWLPPSEAEAFASALLRLALHKYSEGDHNVSPTS
jgi:hypothetical protein